MGEVDQSLGLSSSMLPPSACATSTASRTCSSAAKEGLSEGWAFLLNKCVKEESTEPNKSLPSVTYPPSVILLKKVGAEFIGTFLLIFAAAGSSIINEKTDGGVTYIGVAASSGLAVMIVILSTGHISGAHLNPSVTLAFATIKQFPWIQVPFYVGAQIAASVMASFTLKVIFHPYHSGGVTIPSGTVFQCLVIEFIITFGLMFVVTAVATDTRAVGELAGLAVGATVTLNNIVAGAISGASMNPVRTLGPAIVEGNYRGIWVYMVGPSLGAVTGAAAYTLVRFNNQQDGSLRSFRR